MGSVYHLELTLNLSIDLSSCRLEHIVKAFVKAIKGIFEQIVSQALGHFASEAIVTGTLARLLGLNRVTWKSSTGTMKTTIITPFGKISIPQLQVKDADSDKRHFITRTLLGIEKWRRIPEITKRYFGLMGALAPLRIVNKFFSLFTGMKLSLMTIVQCIRDTARDIDFGIDDSETNVFEADGTGLPILHAGKRGKELEILAQRTQKGRIRIAGMTISGYKQGWKTLFAPLRDALKRFTSIFLVTDGDTSPLLGLDRIKVILQRCLFHIPHEMKYTLWKDGVKRKSETWTKILARIYSIVNLKRIRDEPKIIKRIIASKRNLLTRLIHMCEELQLSNTAGFLASAKADIFSGIERRLQGGTTSLIERVMRTVNQRINVGVWSPASALAVSKIRGAYYYNGFDV